MAFEVKVPAVGESVQEGMIYKWHVKDGDFIEQDDVLVELETDKATVEIVAEVSGGVATTRKEGEVVKVGDVIATIDTEAKGAEKPVATENSVEIASAAASSSAASPELPAQKVAQTSSVLSPAVNRMVHENNLNPAEIAASGRGGRLTKGDVIEHLEAPRTSSAGLKAVSAVDRVESKTVPGARGIRREPMSMLRRRIAERLLEAQKNNAILTTFNEVDMAPIMNLRKQYKDKFKEKHGVGLGFMSFFIKASVEALQAYPAVNGHVEEKEIVYHDYCDIGVAVSTNRGLMVPVIRNCETLSFAEIESAIVDYSVKGRDGKITMDDLNGGTFTVSNGGVFGSLLSTPILNPPQSAILGMHKIEERAVVVGGNIVVKPMMYLAVSYDHRIIDGKEAVSFLVKIKECLEDPARLLLGV